MPSVLHRLEMGEQNVTLRTLEHLTKRFKCSIADLFRGRGTLGFLSLPKLKNATSTFKTHLTL